MSFPVNFRFISGEISTEKNFGKIVLHQKIRPWISKIRPWAIFDLSHSFPPLSAFKTISAVNCQLVPWLLKGILKVSKKIILKKNIFAKKIKPTKHLWHEFHEII